MTSKFKIYAITNHLDTMNKKDLPNGFQTALVGLDDLGVMVDGGNNSLNWHDKDDGPALRLPLTDTELGASFAIEFVAQRAIEDVNKYLLYTSALKIYYLNNSLVVDMNGVVDTIEVLDMAHNFILKYENDEYILILNRTLGLGKSVTFTPSGESFADSTHFAPIGLSNYKRFWYGDDYTKFDLQKSLDAGEKAKNKLLGL